MTQDDRSLSSPELAKAVIWHWPQTFAACAEHLPAVLNSARHTYAWLVPAAAYSRSLCEARKDVMHDFSHIERVVLWALRLWMREKGGPCRDADLEIVLAAALFHDAVVSRKDHPARTQDTEASAVLAEAFLRTADFPAAKLPEVGRIIRNCSFSRGGKTVQSSEEAIVRDADMLECLGAFGLARFFAGGGAMDRPFHGFSADFFDPSRHLERGRWTYDAILDRGLAVEERFFTESARVFNAELRLGEEMRRFLAQFAAEASHVALLDQVLVGTR